MNRFMNCLKMSKIIILIALLFFMLNKTGFSENLDSFSFDKDAFIESAKEKIVLRIGLTECVTYALNNNSEIKIVKIEPEIKQDDVIIAKSAFEPNFTLDWLLHDNTEISAIPFITGDTTNKDKTIVLNAGINGLLYTGTKYSFDFLNTRHESNSTYQVLNPEYTVVPKISISQPILKNAGIDINRAEITIAQNIKKATDEVFKSTVIDIISSTKTAYYKYIYAIKTYNIAKASLKRAHDLLKINRARYKKGLISSVDLLETETAVAEKIKYLISSESSLKTAEDNLKLITNLIDDPAAWNAKIELTYMPEFRVQKLELMNSLLNAFQYRPDYQAKKIELENNDVAIMVTKNGLLPTLDLVGSFGLNGFSGTYGDALDSIESKYKDWSAGIALSIPWGSGNRAMYDKAKLEKMQALINLKRLEQKIILDVRDKVREVDIQYRQVRATRISKEKEEENYKAQMERYSAGQVSTHDILDYQDKLALAELSYTTALIDYNIAIINLDKSEGLTLARNNIKLEGQ